jgi:hypothetical protein
MSNTSSPTPEERKAKLEEIFAILRGRGVPANCPRCGRNDWHAEILGYLVSPLPVTSFGVPPPHVPALSLTCKNCGAMQLHSLGALGIQI